MELNQLKKNQLNRLYQKVELNFLFQKLRSTITNEKLIQFWVVLFLDSHKLSHFYVTSLDGLD